MNISEAQIAVDPWVASSLLQKAIRRGDVEVAQAAAAKFYHYRGAGIWRRLQIIAFEDIGIADLDLVADVVEARPIKKLADQPREIWASIRELVSRMALAPKDRSTDYAICSAVSHPESLAYRGEVMGLSEDARVALAIDQNQPFLMRAMATWHASGVNGGGPALVNGGDLKSLLGAFAKAGLSSRFAQATETAARVTREPIVVMAPLIWSLADQSNGIVSVKATDLPATEQHDGVPLYAFDKHTSLGKQAIARLAHRNEQVSRVLSRYVPDFRAVKVAEIAVFYADGFPVRDRLQWEMSERLEKTGMEADMTKVGCPMDGVTAVIETVRENLAHLNQIRLELIERRDSRRSEGGV